MEKYNGKRNFLIVSISRSNADFALLVNPVPNDVKFSLTPYLLLDEESKLSVVTISAQFFTKDDNPITNTLNVQVVFRSNDVLPVVKEKGERVKVNNYDDLLSMFDTAIGVFRGILCEWLKGTELQRPLPFVDMENFVKEARISFSEQSGYA